MLSILIPTYDYDIYYLVSVLHKQVCECNLDFEIICLDDFSTKFISENQQINVLENCSYSVLEKNIGRSSIRNLLAQKAKFEYLLFLDADTIPVDPCFVSNYITQINQEEKIVYGGIQYQKEKPKNTQLLRWVYGNAREALSVVQRNNNPYLTFLSLNFLIKKSVFNTVVFNESIPNLRHEDTLFSFELQKNAIQIVHIENPVCHLGIENSLLFLRKSEEALTGLKHLIETSLIDPKYIKISGFYLKIKKIGLQRLFLLLFKGAKPLFIKQLLSNKPSLFIFDLYRLGYYCILNFK